MTTLDEVAQAVTAWCQERITQNTGWVYSWSVAFVPADPFDEEPFYAEIHRWWNGAPQEDADFYDTQELGGGYAKTPQAALRSAWEAAKRAAAEGAEA